MRYVLAGDVNTLNPTLGGLALENTVTEAIFDGLVKLNDRDDVAPDLALAVPRRSNGGISKDGRTLTYHLRHGVVWHDGQPFSSADVAFTYATITNPHTNAPNVSAYRQVEWLATPDPYTVVVRLKSPSAPAVGQLFCNGENGQIIPKHLLENSADFNRDAFGLHPVGTGPMQFDRWEHGSRIVLKSNPHYFAGAPHIRELQLLVVPDANTRLTMATAKEADVVGIAPNDLDRVKTLTGYTVMEAQGFTEVYLTFNVTRTPFDDVRVRRALMMALDRKRIVENSLRGTATLANSLMPPYHWAYVKDNGVLPFDPAAAGALLKQAGWTPGPDGIRRNGERPLAFTLISYSGSATRSALAQQIQIGWRAAGADVSLRLSPANVLLGTTGLLTTGKFDASLDGFTFDPDPDRAYLIGRRFFPPRGFNASRYQNARADELSDKAMASYEASARAPLYFDLQRLLNRDVPMIPLAWPKSLYLVNADLRGFKPEPVNSDFWNVQDWQI
ncbi:MAG: hypothetical protein GIX00_03155 [Candidatus Eremiobacteraeota bacterium]|nr:hypothetical protein [Candidatus Eremiobacteraeota bacterium]